MVSAVGAASRPGTEVDEGGAVTSEYVCSICSQLVSVSGEPGMWINARCSNCGTEVKVWIQEEDE